MLRGSCMASGSVRRLSLSHPSGSPVFAILRCRSSNALPLGGDVGQATLGSSAGLFLPATQWSVTAGLEKTLVKFSNGATVGVVTDLIVPVQTTSAVTGDPRLSGMKSAALRFGMVLRW